MPERDYSNDPDDYYRNYPDGQHPGGVTPPTGQAPAAPVNNDPETDPHTHWNNGSPPNLPLQAGHGWEWNGSSWTQVAGRGLGYSAPAAAPAPSGGGGSAPAPSSGGGSVSGVPTAWNVKSSQLGGSVPTLADAIRDSKQLQQAPTVNPYAVFQPPTSVGLDGRNNIINSIMAKPQVMDQQFQDQLFEQQKEQQSQLAAQAKGRISQQGAGRGLSATGGYQAGAMGQVEGDFMNQLLAGRRDVSVKAAEANRASEHAAVQMQEAIAQGDYVRAHSAYETQLKASALYDEMRFKAAEFDRANVALSAQVGMAGRQQQMAEQVSSFQQYIEKAKFEEMMRQFNEQIGLDYGKFGWNQQMDILGNFPK